MRRLAATAKPAAVPRHLGRQIVVDTNVLVSFLTDRNVVQQEQAAGLFAQATAGELELILHQAVITELVYVLANLYGQDDEAIAATIGDFLALPGVTASDEIAWQPVLELWPKKVRGFADTILVAVARQGRYEAIATFDVKLRRALERHGLRSYW